MPSTPQLWLECLSAAVDLQSLSAEECRWGEPLPEPRRQQYWWSRALLRQRLAQQLGLAAAAVPLWAPPGQAPQLRGGGGWLGLSHSGPALLIGWGAEPFGLDLEHISRPLQARLLLRRWFPPMEQLQLEPLAEAPLREAVLRSWVLKEAAIKWRRRGLAQELTCWCFDHGHGQLRQLQDGLCPSWRAGLLGPWRWAVVAPALRGVELQFRPLLQAESIAGLCQK